MNSSKLLPVLAGAALALGPFLTSADAIDDVTVAATVPHPHYPMNTAVACVQGKIGLSWFTVPHNPEQVKKAGPNYIWYRGFQFANEVAVKSGDVEVPAGSYGFGFQLDASGKKWSIVLIPKQLQQLAFRSQRRGFTQEIKDGFAAFAEKGVKIFTLPTSSFEAKDAEHLAVFAINYGNKMKGRGKKATAISGVEAEYRVSFGDLHTAFKFTEVLAKKAADPVEGEKKDAAKRVRR